MKTTTLFAALLLVPMFAFAGNLDAYYQRIQPGMNLNEVERLLGHPGREVRESELARAVDRSLPVGHPQRVKPVISGERYVRWEKGSGYIIVSLRGEVIAEKWYWEPGPDR